MIPGNNLPETDGDDETWNLQPEQGRSPGERERLSTFYPPVSDEDQRPERFQFPLAALLILTTFAAFGMMATSWSNRTIFAGVLGFPALAAAYHLCFDPPESWEMKTLCWGLLISYGLACVVALFA